MSDTKVRLIEAKDAKELVSKMNADEEDRFASQIMITPEGTFVAFMFCNSNKKEKKQFSGNIKDPEALATERQKYRLEKEGFKGSMDKITKREASMAIDDLDKQKN